MTCPGPHILQGALTVLQLQADCSASLAQSQPAVLDGPVWNKA